MGHRVMFHRLGTDASEDQVSWYSIVYSVFDWLAVLKEYPDEYAVSVILDF